MSTSTDTDETQSAPTSTSGLRPAVVQWLNSHFDECAAILDLEEPFILRDVEDAVHDMSTMRKMTNRDVIYTVGSEQDEDGYRHLWEMDNRARKVLEEHKRDNELPCGHRISWKNVPEGYQCKVCGEIHSREAVEACL